AHSFWPWRIGREATLFDVRELSYDSILSALRTQEGLNGTVEVEPSYGKYHWDGHRACNLSLSPKETAKHKGICPVCKKPLTIGV
ncbi:TPA: DNA helicase UvrD, partial [Candidatus Woesearchaeota archaeon]|nr:DNA helicase UvrD [Candidatus Woesearchaeota archaeon]